MDHNPPHVRILHLDDSASDAMLIKAMIDDANHELSASIEFVASKEPYLTALRSGAFDVILSDHRMPGYDGDEALRDAKAVCPDIPFIMVTGELGEERAIETLKAGATDYVLKDGIKRLVPSIKRALKEAHLERERRKSEEKYRQIVETVSDAIVSTDKDLIIRSWNKAAERVYGWRAEEVLGLKGPDILRTSFPEGVTREAITQAIFGQGRWEGELIQRTKAGVAVTIHASSMPLTDDEGNVIGGVSISHDITARKQAEEQLERSNERINQILTSIQEDFYVVDRNWTFVYANEQFTSKLGKQPEDLLGKNVWEIFPKHVGSVLGVNFRAAMERREIRRFEMSGEYTNAWYSVAVYPTTEGITVLGLDITERKRAEERIEDLARFPGENPSPILRVSSNGVLLYANQASAALLSKWKAVVGEEAPSTLKELVSRLGGMEQARQTIDVPAADRIYNFMSAPILERGYVNLYGREVTERKSIEEALAASERNYRELLETANSIILRWDNQGILRFVNDYGLRFLGYTREDLLGHDVMTIVPKVERSTGRNLESLINDILRDPERYTANANENMRKDGTTVWVAWTNKAILDEQGEVHEILAIGNDITPLKEAEGALKASEENLRLMVNQASDAMMIIDSDGVIEAVSQLGTRLLGYDEGDLVGKHASNFAATFSRLETFLVLDELRKQAPKSKTVSARIKTKTGEGLLMSLTVKLLNVGTKAEKFFVKFSDLDFLSARKPSPK